MSFIIAAPASGSGKTTVTLGLLRALRDRGMPHHGAKSGPDYIDPRFHEAASGLPCLNLVAWAMTSGRIRALCPDPVVIEGAMGLFDGAPDGRGATADLARILDLPVVLVIDAGRMSQSIAPLVQGFAHFDASVMIAGVILNNVGSSRHEAMLRAALARVGQPVLGVVPRQAGLSTPSRHLGLVQAQERGDLEAFISGAASLIAPTVDLDALLALGQAPQRAAGDPSRPPAGRIAIARDRAFAFAYPHLLRDWQAAGAEIMPFSPLADDAVPAAELIYLPGGYPELHAGRIAENSTFLNSLRFAAKTTDIYGECGGYMVLGQTLADAEGHVHRMSGLLDLDTSFASRKLHLGYRTLCTETGPLAGRWSGHEFHYCTTLRAEGEPLFHATDALGETLPPMGLRRGRVFGSFAHIIDRAP
jgi:cobyrinic acid a,c-diamide synthase